MKESIAQYATLSKCEKCSFQSKYPPMNRNLFYVGQIYCFFYIFCNNIIIKAGKSNRIQTKCLVMNRLCR